VKTVAIDARAIRGGFMAIPLEFATNNGLQRAAVITGSKAMGCAVVNLDQFRITTKTILAKEHFGSSSSFPSSKATMNEVREDTKTRHGSEYASRSRCLD
jgi:hypothetical protein